MNEFKKNLPNGPGISGACEGEEKDGISREDTSRITSSRVLKLLVSIAVVWERYLGDNTDVHVHTRITQFNWEKLTFTA